MRTLVGCLVGTLASCLWAQSPPTAAPAPIEQRLPTLLLIDSLPDPSQSECLERDRVGPWVCIGQDPSSYQTGVIDLDDVLNRIQYRTRGNLPKWMMLDFEDPFFKNLAAPRDSPEYKRTVYSMVTAIRAMKQRWPESKWTYYGLPNLPYWLDGKTWGNASREAMKTALDEAAAAAAPIIAECDWVSVSIYSPYDPAMVIPGDSHSLEGTPESVRADGRQWRKARVGLAKLLANGKPVIPNVCPYWTPGGIAPTAREIPARQFIEDQVAPALAEGANGLAVWTGIGYQIQMVTAVAEKQESVGEQGFGVTEWRKALASDYLGGATNIDWADPAIRARLEAGTSQFLCRSLNNIRAWEANGTLPAAPPPTPSAPAAP